MNSNNNVKNEANEQEFENQCLDEDEVEDEELDEEEREWVRRAEIGKGQDNLQKQQQVLEATTGVYLPASGLRRRDFALYNMGMISWAYKNQIILTKFEEKISGVTDQDSLLWWHLHNHTRKYMFVRTRTRKGSDVRKEVATKVTTEFLVGIALNLGGEEWTKHQDKHWRLKHGTTGQNAKQNVVKFLKKEPKQMQPAKGKKKAAFGESMANFMDREVLLANNPMFKSCFELKIVNNYPEFQKWLDKVKSLNLDLNGNENAGIVNKILIEKIATENAQKENMKKSLREQMQNGADRAKDQFVEALVELGISQLNFNLVDDFTELEFNELTKYINSALKKVNNNLVNVHEKIISKEILSEYLLLFLEKRK